MILYNVTAIVDDSIHLDWQQWMQNVHIGEVMSSGCFVSNRLLRVVDSPNEGVTFCIQYIAESMDNYRVYQREYLGRSERPYPEHFQNKFVTFPTVMEFIDSV